MGGRVGSGRQRFQLHGNSLRTYLYLLRHERAGVREVQRALAFSSPSLAQYHLDKLLEMGLAVTNNGEYRLVKEVEVPEIGEFFRIGSCLLPRFLVYAVMFTTLLLYFVLQVPFESVEGVYALISLSLAAAVLWFETWSAWKKLPQ